MSLLNYSVYCVSSRKTILPWRIADCSLPSLTFKQFYDQHVVGCDYFDPLYVLKQVFVGHSKENMDLVDYNLIVAEVISIFGRYLKYTVELPQATQAQVQVHVRSAFSVLMEAQKELSSRKFMPDLITEPKNAKQRLMNDVIEFFRGKECKWTASECQSAGTSLIHAITNALWAIDGHHAVLANQGFPLPSFAKQFVNYNRPELSKHRKREGQNMSRSELNCVSSHLFDCLQALFWTEEPWSTLKGEVEKLANSIHNYSEYLQRSAKKSCLNQSQLSPVRQVAENLSFQFIPQCSNPEPLLNEICEKLEECDDYEYLPVENFSPATSSGKYNYLKTLKNHGLPFLAVLVTYTHGNNVGNLNFVWKVSSCDESAFSASQAVILRLQENIPSFHTRAMKKQMFERFGRLMPSVKPAILRYVYRTFTGDASAASSLDEKVINDRVQLFLDMEDPDVVLDLRALNSSQKTQYDTFWDETQKYLREDVGLAAEERRHSEVTHMARVISVRDLLDQVSARCPPGTKIPSRSWLSLQFWPKSAHAKSRVHYTGRFNVKYMVQARQFRKSHEDAHYAAAVFRYQRELAVHYRRDASFVCMDDKHRIKVGEPKYPVAATDRGRRVIVGRNESFEVADHDFTKFGIIPSVSFFVDIPEDVTESWYDGRVFIGMKEAVFEPSSPHRHMTELVAVLKSEVSLANKPLLFIYSDGGPDHRLTYLSVQLSLISVFLEFDLDFLCAARTAPHHSWRNPAERIMSLINLGLQCVGIMRKEMAPEDEATIANCNSMAQLRKVVESKPNILQAVQDSIEPVKILLSDIMCRLKLKGKSFSMFTAASELSQKLLWQQLEQIDQSLKFGAKHQKKDIQNFPLLVKFLSHCCQVRHYSFTIKKCGDSSCSVCKPVRMAREAFDTLSFLPDPVPGEEGHYRPFGNVYRTPTTEEFRPSLASRSKQRTMPFSPSIQHVKNADIMIQCEECQMWRLVYSKYKMKSERTVLHQALENFSFTCGAMLSDLELGDERLDGEHVFVRSVRCYEPLEKLYYSVGTYELICIYCCSNENLNQKQDCYPQCTPCELREPIKKRK